MDSQHKRPVRLYRYLFGTAEFDEAKLELRIDGVIVAIERRPLSLLAKILEHADQVVTKRELLQSVWDGRVTVENVLANAMAKLRKALGDNALQLVTIPRVGYRIKGPIIKMEAKPDCNIITSCSNTTVNNSLFTSARIMPPPAAYHHLDVISLNPSDDFGTNGVTYEAQEDPELRTSAFQPFGDATLEAWAGRHHLDVMPLEQRLNLFMSVAKEVSMQHAKGKVHSFLQPHNLIVSDEGRIRITAPGNALMDSARDRNHNRCNCLYRAPETYRNGVVSQRSDIYSLGVLLYQIVISDFSRPLLPDWRQDVTNRSIQHTIEAATHSCPSLRPRSVEDLILPLSTYRIGHHQKPETWNGALEDMLRQ